MTAPIRFLTGRQQQQKIGVEGSTENQKVLEVVGLVGIGSTIFEPSATLDVRGSVNIRDGLTLNGLEVGAGSSLGTLYVSGISTFNSDVDINASVDVSNDLNVTGFSTFASNLDINASVDIQDNLVVNGTLFSAGITTLASDGGITTTGGNLFVGNDLSVSGTSTATRFSTGASGVGINIDSNTITGPSEIIIDPAAVGDDTGSVRIKGDLYVDGEQFVVKSSIIELADYRIGIGTTAPNDQLLDGAGIGIGSAADQKTFTWDYTNSALKSSENLNLASGKVYQIDGTEVLSATQLTVENIDTSGIGTIGGVKISSGIVTAVSGVVTYYGNQVIGTPTGGSFRAGAYVPQVTDFTKDSIDELNYILGKLVPNQPDNINGVALSLTGTAGVGRLCSGFTPTNNTNDANPIAGTQYTRNTDNTVTTNYLTEYGPGDSGTVTGYVNSVGVGTTTLNVSFGLYAVKSDNGTYGSLQIANDKDAADSTRNTGISSLFYEVYDVRLIDAPCPDGYNEAYITQGSSTTQSVYWYEDPSTVAAPIITFGAVSSPSSPTLSYSSGVPHYTESTNNNFTYVLSVENATGDMYTQNTFLNSDGQTNGFQNPGSKSYTDFDGGTNPPVRNYGVGTAVTTLIAQTPRDVHLTLTSSHFTTFDATTPYGTHSNQRVSYSTNINIMGTTAITSKIDEDNILISSLGTGSGNATRTNAASGDNPVPIYTSWNPSTTAATYEAIVRGGVLRHDQTNYSTGYLPVGPDYSSGRSGAQYFQVELIRSNVSEFNISYTGSCAGCWVSMPDNSTWTTSLSGVNGWADMFQAYRGSGVPTTAEPGCSSGGVMDTNGGSFTCVFGTESSSNDSNNRILVRWKLTSGQSITAMSFSNT